jgi:alpha-tubulin suppressor-like RCC1 family protein
VRNFAVPDTNCSPIRLAAVLAPALIAAALGCREDATSPSTPEATPALGTSSTAALTFRQVSAGSFDQTCGVTTDNRAYCWGNGRPGNGTISQNPRPVLVFGGLPIRQVSVGAHHICAVTTDNQAYCWGDNSTGQVGDGTTTDRLVPVPVAGGLQFRQVSAGGEHSCGLTTDNRAYCWGDNYEGQLGDGTGYPTNTQRLTPVAVVGGHRFRQVSAGFIHSCGVTPTYQAFCWGSNRKGELGDGTNVGQRLKPVAVAGGHSFRQLSAGWEHTCAVTIGSRAFCWGDGSDGQIGDGKTYLRFTPRAVAGGLLFSRVSAGVFSTCGETTNNRAYCWGTNTYGGLGDGTTNWHSTPVAVRSGLYFRQLSAGGFYACGVTPASVAYCWGWNYYGQLGDGTTTDRSTPVPVAGPM